jgi:prenylated cyclic peptide (anacyclamide/piricyclamide family)
VILSSQTKKAKKTMKKTLKPQRTAPVSRTTVGNSSQVAVEAAFSIGFSSPSPFAGDDAE